MFRRFFLFTLVLTLSIMGYAYYWLLKPLELPHKSSSVELAIEPGMTSRSISQAVADAGVKVEPLMLYTWFRLSGEARNIKAGNYELNTGVTPASLLNKLVRGDVLSQTVVLVEGWSFRQLRAALAQATDLKPDSARLSDAEVMSQLGRPGLHPEGRFFPDTYAYNRGSSDLTVLKRAMHAMDRKLDAAWARRASGIPLQSKEEALILASIVEKETGQAADRAQIAGVFTNRMRRGMLLQTDPTVIYGLGTSFDGNLRKRDLLADTPYNTYTRGGLPPTPIAMPGQAALMAAVQPAQTNALFFVARGDGSSHFSATLDEHNRAVNRYQK